MILFINTYGQSSLDLLSFNGDLSNYKHRLNSFESNPANHINKGDWQLSASFNSIFGNDFSSGLYALSLGKVVNQNYFYLRFTPGIYSQFQFVNSTTVTTSDNIEIESDLKTELTYNENFGFGYSYNFNPDFTIGFSLRYINQKFDEQSPLLNLTSDSVNYISTKTTSTEMNYWLGNLGVSYRLSNNLQFSLGSINLFSFSENDTSSEFEINKEKAVQFGVSINFLDGFNAFGNAESNGSFTFSTSHVFDFFNGKLGYSISVNHDKLQSPFISSVMPSINYTNDIYSVTLSYLKYTSDRNTTFSLSQFLKDGINSIANNNYSKDKAQLSLNIALSFVPDKKARFLDIEYVNNIYPTLTDEYYDKPFAKAKVLNLTDKQISIKPSSFIENLNDEIVHSPSVVIAGNDTSTVFFYTVIEGSKLNIKKNILTTADFYLTTSGSQFDDEIQKPILLYDRNSWNGSVSTLKYFVFEGLNKSEIYAKEVLSKHAAEINAIDEKLNLFMKIEILFDHFVENMLYVSDPRSNTEKVQFPLETIELKGGDCDDLSVSFASILESIGIQTAFVDYKEDLINHVNLLINTKLDPSYANLITNNDKKIFIRKNSTGEDEIWIPIELTTLTNFKEAWEVGSEKFYENAVNSLGLSKGTVSIVDIY